MAFRQVLGVVIVVTVASFCVALGHRTPANDLPPVVIVPGDGGSQLEARIQRKGLGNGGCDVDEDWFRLWLNVLELRPGNNKKRNNSKVRFFVQIQLVAIFRHCNATRFGQRLYGHRDYV